MYTVATGRYFIEIIMMSNIKLLMTVLVTVTAANAAAPTPKAYQPLTQDQQDALCLDLGLIQLEDSLYSGVNPNLSTHKETIDGEEVIVIDAGSLSAFVEDPVATKKLLLELPLEEKLARAQALWECAQMCDESTRTKLVELAMSDDPKTGIIMSINEEILREAIPVLKRALLIVIEDEEMYQNLLDFVAWQVMGSVDDSIKLYQQSPKSNRPVGCGYDIPINGINEEDAVSMLSDAINWSAEKVIHPFVVRFLKNGKAAYLQKLQSEYDRCRRYFEYVMDVGTRLQRGDCISQGERQKLAYEDPLCLYVRIGFNPADQAALDNALVNHRLFRQIVATMIVRTRQFGYGWTLHKIRLIPKERSEMPAKYRSDAGLTYHSLKIHYARSYYEKTDEFAKALIHETGHVKHYWLNVLDDRKKDDRQMMDAVLSGRIPRFVDQFAPMLSHKSMELGVQSLLRFLDKQKIEELQTALVGCNNFGDLARVTNSGIFNSDQLEIIIFWCDAISAVLQKGMTPLISEDWRNLLADGREHHVFELTTPLMFAKLIYVTSTLLYRDSSGIFKSRYDTVEEVLTIGGRVPLMTTQRLVPGGATVKKMSVVVDEENEYARDVRLDAQFDKIEYHNLRTMKSIPPELFGNKDAWEYFMDIVDSGYLCFDQPASHYAPMLTDGKLMSNVGIFQLLLAARGVESAQMETYISGAKRLGRDNSDMFDIVSQLLEQYPMGVPHKMKMQCDPFALEINSRLLSKESVKMDLGLLREKMILHKPFSLV
jgi:hypothetical protein